MLHLSLLHRHPPNSTNPAIISSLHRQRPKTPRRQSKLSNLDRRRICEYAADHPKATQEDIALQWGIDRSSVSKILKYREKWLSISPNARAAKVIKHRGGRFPLLESEVVRRCRDRARQGVLLGDRAIKDLALQVSAELGLPHGAFKASNGWLDAFKDRAQIKAGSFVHLDHLLSPPPSPTHLHPTSEHPTLPLHSHPRSQSLSNMNTYQANGDGEEQDEADEEEIDYEDEEEEDDDEEEEEEEEEEDDDDDDDDDEDEDEDEEDHQLDIPHRSAHNNLPSENLTCDNHNHTAHNSLPGENTDWTKPSAFKDTHHTHTLLTAGSPTPPLSSPNSSNEPHPHNPSSAPHQNHPSSDYAIIPPPNNHSPDRMDGIEPITSSEDAGDATVVLKSTPRLSQAPTDPTSTSTYPFPTASTPPGSGTFPQFTHHPPSLHHPLHHLQQQQPYSRGPHAISATAEHRNGGAFMMDYRQTSSSHSRSSSLSLGSFSQHSSSLYGPEDHPHYHQHHHYLNSPALAPSVSNKVHPTHPLSSYASQPNFHPPPLRSTPPVRRAAPSLRHAMSHPVFNSPPTNINPPHASVGPSSTTHHLLPPICTSSAGLQQYASFPRQLPTLSPISAPPTHHLHFHHPPNIHKRSFSGRSVSSRLFELPPLCSSQAKPHSGPSSRFLGTKDDQDHGMMDEDRGKVGLEFDEALGALETVMRFLQDQPTSFATPRDYMVVGELFGRMKEKKQELIGVASGGPGGGGMRGMRTTRRINSMTAASCLSRRSVPLSSAHSPSASHVGSGKGQGGLPSLAKLGCGDGGGLLGVTHHQRHQSWSASSGGSVGVAGTNGLSLVIEDQHQQDSLNPSPSDNTTHFKQEELPKREIIPPSLTEAPLSSSHHHHHLNHPNHHPHHHHHHHQVVNHDDDNNRSDRMEH